DERERARLEGLLHAEGVRIDDV
ncbi:MAG: hypothetical protein QOE87_2373, partial [Gaiellales bacterium]|nr:hypothetical protein [Gaiellales bacterium]